MEPEVKVATSESHSHKFFTKTKYLTYNLPDSSDYPPTHFEYIQLTALHAKLAKRNAVESSQLEDEQERLCRGRGGGWRSKAGCGCSNSNAGKAELNEMKERNKL